MNDTTILIVLFVFLIGVIVGHTTRGVSERGKTSGMRILNHA